MYHKVKLYTECKYPRMENYVYKVFIRDVFAKAYYLY